MATEYSEPPPGVHPNYDHPTTLVGLSLAVNILFPVLITISVLLRQYTRCCIARFPFSADDFFCILSYVLSMTFSGLSIYGSTIGLGYQAWEMPLAWAPRFMVFAAICSLTEMVAMAAVKLTFLSFYCHYFWLHTTCRRMVIAGIVIVILYTLTFVSLATATMAVVPVPGSFHEYVEGPQPSIIFGIYIALNAAMDLYILLLPLPCLWEFDVNVRSRGKVIGLFIGGLCACIAGIVAAALSPNMIKSIDLAWNMAILESLASLEVNIGIMCACALLWPAFIEGKGPARIASALVACLRCRPRPRRAERRASVLTLPDMLTMELCPAENRGSIGSSPGQG